MIIDPDFPDHWKTRMLVGLLDDDELAPLYILRLWGHCQLRREWVFQTLPPSAMKALCRYIGHPLKLDTALQTSGFIHRKDTQVIVHEWEQYNASLIAAWNNGSKGGRPPKPRDTPGLPSNNPDETHGFTIGVDRNGLDKKKTKRETRNGSEPGIPEALANLPEFQETWEAFQHHRKKIRKPMTDFAEKLILKKLSERPLYALSALSMTIEKGWQGFEWEWIDKETPKERKPIRAQV